MRIHEIEQLARISVLEEENSNIKRALFKALHDRDGLIDEVYYYFQNIDSFLHIRDRLLRESSSDVASLGARPFEVNCSRPYPMSSSRYISLHR